MAMGNAKVFASNGVYANKSELVLLLNSELDGFDKVSSYRYETVKLALTVVEHSSEADVMRFADSEFVFSKVSSFEQGLDDHKSQDASKMLTNLFKTFFVKNSLSEEMKELLLQKEERKRSMTFPTSPRTLQQLKKRM